MPGEGETVLRHVFRTGSRMLLSTVRTPMAISFTWNKGFPETQQEMLPLTIRQLTTSLKHLLEGSSRHRSRLSVPDGGIASFITFFKHFGLSQWQNFAYQIRGIGCSGRPNHDMSVNPTDNSALLEGRQAGQTDLPYYDQCGEFALSGSSPAVRYRARCVAGRCRRRTTGSGDQNIMLNLDQAMPEEVP
jgi:hypothetical protein